MKNTYSDIFLYSINFKNTPVEKIVKKGIRNKNCLKPSYTDGLTSENIINTANKNKLATSKSKSNFIFLYLRFNKK